MRTLRAFGWTVLTAALLLSAREASAQARMVIVVGLADSELAGDDATVRGFGDRKGFHVGVSGDVPIFGRLLTFGPGATYLERGFSYPNGTTRVKLSYLEVSVPLRVNVPVGDAFTVTLFAGPGFGLEFGCALTDEQENLVSTLDCQSSDFDFRSWDLTTVFGAGVTVPVSERAWVVANAALDGSFRSIDSGSPKADFKHRSLLINAGVSVPLGRSR
jgi:hypothetical protein